MKKFQIFSGDISKMHYFSNKVSKITKRWGSPAPAPFNFWYWWPRVA